jgi:drug/metabolite transporter (DMT)-like permease
VATVYILGLNAVLIIATGGIHWLTWQQLCWLLTIGGLGGTANLLFIAATRSAPASMVAPVQYSQIFWAVLFGAVFYAEYPDAIAYLGLVVIVVAGIFNVISSGTEIRIFSRSSPSGAGPATIEESEVVDTVLDGPIVGAAEAASER